MSKAPILTVKEVFKSKDKLVAAVQSLASSELWVDRLNAVKGLARISNRKLLRLHELLSFAKDKFGTRQKLVDSILDLEKKSKDQGLRSKLESWPLPRLLDRYRTSERQSKHAARAKEAAETKPQRKPKAPAKKQPAKKQVAKKPAAGKKKAPGKRSKK
jgi:hypothetical protein